MTLSWCNTNSKRSTIYDAFIVYQVTVADPLWFVFTAWSYNSRVSIKAPTDVTQYYDMI